MPKILVIEDEELIRSLILELLKTASYQVLGADNGITGIQMAQQEQPDLIICDVTMPGMDGHGVLQQLQSHSLTASIPFIFLTANADRHQIRQGMELGADDYLTKPCTPEELIGAVSARLKKQLSLQQVYHSVVNQAMQQLNDSIFYDSLTHLPNRLALREKFRQLLEGTLEPKISSLIPIICVNIDRFNRINETLGHEIGDKLLHEVAQRLACFLLPHQIVARLDADEFAIVLSSTGTPGEITQFAQILIEILSKPFHISEYELFLTTSVGIAFYPNDGDHLEVLLQKANKAMSESKNQGGNRYAIYTSALQITTFEELTLENDLRYALQRNEFQVYYQPKINIKTGKITSVEALLRWKHSQRGFIPPNQFIPIAEETGLIELIGEWVLSQACQQTKRWQQMGIESLQVAVNLSSRQFNQEDLSQRLLSILEQTHLHPSFLEIELTESTLVENPQIAVYTMQDLKAIGVKIAIDDFGTGYSSLSYLEQFPFDVLKIDQCFVRNVNHKHKNAAIVRAIIQMAHQLNLKVIAEGVETEEELSFLTENDCDEVQGYLLSVPLAVAEFEDLITSHCGCLIR